MAPSARETERFEQLLTGCERPRAGGLRFEALRELGALYRTHAGALARLRDRGDDPDALRHLNALCVRGYTVLYAKPGRGFASAAYPGSRLRALAPAWPAVAAAGALLFLGIGVGTALGLRDPAAVIALVPRSLGYTATQLDDLVSSPEARRRFLERRDGSAGEHAFFGSWLFAHNTRVGLLSLATGMLAAVPTVILQLYNGLVIGALAAAFIPTESTVAFLAWILPHAVPELTAICLCAGAGLLLGSAVAAPGRRSRAAALRSRLDAALLLFGLSIPLFLLAALVESFVRESTMGASARFAVGGALAAAVGLMLLALWRAARRYPETGRWIAELSG